MIGAGRPSHDHDVDALARRLPRREPTPDRSAVMRNAVLEAATSTFEAAPRARLRGWMLGGLAAAAAMMCLWLALRDGDRLAPVASTAVPVSHGDDARPATADVAVTATRAPAAAPRAPDPAAPRAPDPAPLRAPGSAGGDAALAATAPEPLPDGVSSFVATRPLLVNRGSATITAPPDARFEVEVRGDEVRHVTVTSGWVVVASGNNRTTVVPARYTWTPDAPAPRPTVTNPPGPPPAAGSPPSASPPAAPLPRAAIAPAAALPPRTPIAPAAAPPPRTAAAPEPLAERRAPGLPSLASPRALADPASERRAPSIALPASPGDTASPLASQRPPEPPAAAAPTGAEQDFRDGLHTLLSGDAAGAIPKLDRACRALSASQDDSCYWAAVAWLRSGARPHARRAFAEVLTRWPGSTHANEAHIALGWLLLEIGDRDGARRHFAAAADDRLPSIRTDALRGLTATQ